MITYQERLRPAFVLVRVELLPHANPPGGHWKEIWQQCLEVVRRCVYLDKDLVLPPMGTAGSSETFFIVASTDLQRSGIMTTRIREQLERIDQLKEKCTVSIAALPVEPPANSADESLEHQVQGVADCVTQMVLRSMERKHLFAVKSAKQSN